MRVCNRPPGPDRAKAALNVGASFWNKAQNNINILNPGEKNAPLFTLIKIVSAMCEVS